MTVYINFVCEGQTVHLVYRKPKIVSFYKLVKRKRHERTKKGLRIRHVTKTNVRVKHEILVFEHPPYSPYLTQFDSSVLFPKIIPALKNEPTFSL